MKRRYLFVLLGLILLLFIGITFGVNEYQTRQSFKLLAKTVGTLSIIDAKANKLMLTDITQTENIPATNGPTPELIERAMLIKERGRKNVEEVEAELQAEAYEQLTIQLLKLSDQTKNAHITSAFLPTKRNILLVLNTKSRALAALVSTKRDEKSKSATSYDALKAKAAWEAANESLSAYAQSHGYSAWYDSLIK
ncbi:MAG: hypothetical protein Q8L35_07315 [Actinomycetota bacterium]|nr:hypothetical protein [Actinomycetota bacterium]